MEEAALKGGAAQAKPFLVELVAQGNSSSSRQLELGLRFNYDAITRKALSNFQSNSLASVEARKV
jgi:hypothetical protein